MSNTIRNQTAVSLGLVTLFAESVDAAYPTVANPIPTQYAEVGQPFSYDIDLNQVFNDADGDIMTFGGVTLADGSPLPSWLTAKPKGLYGYNKDCFAGYTTLFYQNNVIYAGTESCGLYVLDVSNITKPTLIAELPMQGKITDIVSMGNLLLITRGDFSPVNRLSIINVSNPRVPFIISELATQDSNGITLYNHLAFIADKGFGLKIVNITDPYFPTIIGSLDTDGVVFATAISPTISSDLLFLADYRAGFKIVNISNPALPFIVSNISTMGPAHDIVLVDKFALVSDGGIQLINLTDPISASLGSHFSGPYDAQSVTVSGDIGFVSGFASGMAILNISNLTSPTLISALSQSSVSVVEEIILAANYAVVRSWLGLLVLNISELSNPIIIGGEVDYLGHTKRLATGKKDLVLSGSWFFGLQTMNVSNPMKPTIIQGISDFRNFADLRIGWESAVLYSDIYPDIAFIGADIVNISNITTPSVISNLNVPCCFPLYFSSSVVQMNLLFLTINMGNDGGLFIINISNLSSPQIVSNLTTTGTKQGLAINGSLAYVAAGVQGLQIIDVSDALRPTIIATLDTPGTANNVVVLGNFVYLADDDPGLQIINVTNPRAPKIIGNIDTRYAKNVNIVGNVVYVSDECDGVKIIDVSNVTAPQLLGVLDYNTVGCVMDNIVVKNNVIYFSGKGLQIYDIGNTAFMGTIPTNAINGTRYNVSVRATNAQGEWILTNMALKIGARPSAMPVSSIVPTSILSNPNSASINTPAIQNSGTVTFSIIVSSMPIIIVIETSTLLTTDMLSFTGNINPNQVIYTVQGNNPDIVITVNGAEATQFTQADVEGQFVAIELQGTGCQDYDNTLQLQASVAGSSTTVDFSLSVQVTTLSCNAGSRLRDTAVSTIAALLTTTGLGFWAKGRDRKEQAQNAEPSLCNTEMRLKH